jgi:hypothetical protein
MQAPGERHLQIVSPGPVRVGFNLGDNPVGSLGPACELVEQHRLSNPAESAEDKSLSSPANRGAVEEDVDGVDLEIAADKGRRAATRSRAVGIVNRIHSFI